MFRLVLILASLASLQNILCDDSTSSSSSSSTSKHGHGYGPGPGLGPGPANCDSVLCSKNTDDKLDDLIDDIAKSCQCKTCGCKNDKISFDLHSFCEGYRNYDPKTYGLIQCIINKLSNPCYKQYYDRFCQIVFKGCGCSCKSQNFNIYTFISDVCYTCNGCLDNCYLQCGQKIIWYEPVAQTGPKITSIAGTGGAGPQ